MNKNKITEKIHSFKVYKQFLLIFFFGGIVPLLITTICIISIFIREMKKDAVNQFSTANDVVNAEVIKRVNNIDMVISSLSNNYELQSFMLEDYGSPYTFYMAFRKIHSSIVLLTQMYSEIDKIEFYHDNQSMTSGSEFIYEKDFEEKFEELLKNQDISKRVILMEDPNYISIYKRYSLFGEHPRYNTILKVTVPKSCFDDVFTSDTIHYELVKDHMVLSENNVKITSKYALKQKLAPMNGTLFNGYYIQASIDERILYDRLYELFFMQLLIILVCCLFSIFVVYRLICFITVRLTGLARHMEEQKHELTPYVCKRYSDEVGILIDNYNTMVEDINKLIIEKGKNELRKKQYEIESVNAKYYVLCSQINPHFLSNTLNCIRMNCIVKEELETADILGNLSKMFRSTMIYTDAFAAVWQEIELVDNYLRIQKFRFKDKLEYSIIVDKEARELQIPRMILQPLVENSCSYGLQSKKEGGSIQVYAYFRDSNLVLIVTDDGVGIEENKLNQIKQDMNNMQITDSHIGIASVYKRLKLQYRERLEFTIENKDSGGLLIMIKIAQT